MISKHPAVPRTLEVCKECCSEDQHRFASACNSSSRSTGAVAAAACCTSLSGRVLVSSSGDPAASGATTLGMIGDPTSSLTCGSGVDLF